MINYDLHIYKDLQELGRAAADRFLSLSNDAIESAGRFSVALSGGSTPKALHAALLEPERRDRIQWSRCYFFWGDERFVPADHPESNFRMAKETLLSKAPISEENIFPI